MQKRDRAVAGELCFNYAAALTGGEESEESEESNQWLHGFAKNVGRRLTENIFSSKSDPSLVVDVHSHQKRRFEHSGNSTTANG